MALVVFITNLPRRSKLLRSWAVCDSCPLQVLGGEQEEEEAISPFGNLSSPWTVH
jgi:hypothetical protein